MVKQQKTYSDLQGYVAPIAIHPGYTLKNEMDYCGITQKELADRTGISHKTINAIIAEKHPITKDTAQKLGKVFHSPADFWFAIQKRYEMDFARLEKKRHTESEVVLLPHFKNAYSELRKTSVFQENFRWSKNNFDEIINQLQRFFGVASLQLLEDTSIDRFAFRKYKRKNTDVATLAAWLRLGRRKAQVTDVQPFDKKKLGYTVNKLRLLPTSSYMKYLPRIEKLLAECGVVVAYMPLFSNIHTQGAATWISPQKALVMINTHKRDEGKFWFTLFHELGHLLLHSKKEQFVNFDDKDDNINDSHRAQEYEADAFARKQLLPNYETMLDRFIKMTDKDNGNFEEVVKKISKSEGISPAVFAGCLTHEYRDSDPKIFKKVHPLLPVVIDTENVLDGVKI